MLGFDLFTCLRIGFRRAAESHLVHVGTGTKSDKIDCLDYFSRMDARHGLVAEALFKAPSAFFAGRGGGHRRPDLDRKSVV